MFNITYLVTVYNEVETVEKAINDVINLKYPHKEILVIDNGSTDGSQKIIKKFKGIKKILKKKNFGVGNSVVEGIKKAKGKYIYTQHADLEYDHLRSLYMLKYAEKNKLDVVFATRLKKKDFILKKIIKKPAYLATIICTFLINKFYGKEFNDIIGVKLYRKSSLIQIPLNCNNTGFEFYSVSKFCKLNLKIGEVFIKYKPREKGEKKIKFYHIIIAIYQIIKVKFFNYN